MTPFPGHLRAQRTQPLHALALILGHYNDYEPFRQAAHSAGAAWQARLAEGDAARALGAARREIAIPFAERWNLDRIPEIREMNYWRVEQALRLAVERPKYLPTPGPFQMVGLAAALPLNPTLDWEGKSTEWHLERGESVAGLLERARTEFTPTRAAPPTALRREVQSLPDAATAMGWTLGDAHPQLERHAWWLFLRLCPRPTRPWGPTRIAHEDDRVWRDSDIDLDDPISASAVRSALRDLAGLLRIKLPVLRPGPPASKNAN